MTTYGAVISPVCIRIFPMQEPALLSAAKFVMDGSHMDHLLGRFALSERHRRRVLGALQTEPKVLLLDLDLEEKVLAEFGPTSGDSLPLSLASGGSSCGGSSQQWPEGMVVDSGHGNHLASGQAWSRFYERAVKAILVLSDAYMRHALAAGHAEWNKR
jgi:hypothetical protein